ncbi:glycosyltransferase [Flavivirga algicola]|uniref:Glycosyltransferase family 4 protein n=1 Tax=Flavivirga algicola TaxID=2729136 RepID=A0ABX1S343_9FLAO|nr:glycosyltransferase [Flavivirga algicola]NMH89328.1 glycosyltransferase family 4 protein [Flavivirga algicola]
MYQEKKKLLILTNCILEYRLPVYNLLAEQFQVTVAHYGKIVNEEKTKFKEVILTPKTRGPFIFFKENIKKLAIQYDAVIALGDLHIWPFWSLGFIRNRSFSLTFWSIGVSASYSKRFDSDKKWDFFRFKLMNKADSIVFYTDYPIRRYVEDGAINRTKLFVAHNTVQVDHKIDLLDVKKHFLFVGTLYKAKKILDLLDAYLLAYKQNPSIEPLVVIGDGEEKDNIKSWVKKHQLTEKIILKGAIFNQDVLMEYYRRAIALISPGQAGLTVLNAFAYGVPFVTTENAITGGEIFNIINNINGIIYKEDVKKLSEIILDLSSNPKKALLLSKNAQEYYFSKRTMSIMVDGLKKAVDYAQIEINKNRVGGE